MITFFKTKYLQTHGSIKKKDLNDIKIDELLDAQHNQFLLRVERWTNEGSV